MWLFLKPAPRATQPLPPMVMTDVVRADAPTTQITPETPLPIAPVAAPAPPKPTADLDPAAITLIPRGSAQGPALPMMPVAQPNPPMPSPAPKATPSVPSSAKPKPNPLSDPKNAAPKPGAVQIDLNAATQAQLEQLPGVGPALAKRIIDDRSAKGRYTRVEDLDRVRGIGPKLLEKIRPHVTVK